MSVKHRLCCVSASVALAAGCAAHAETCGGRDALWGVAWRIASAVESPIDAGRTKVELQALAVRSGREEVWLGQGGEGWVDGAFYALASAAKAFSGSKAQAEAYLSEAQRLFSDENEWRRTLMARELAKGEAASVLLSGPDGRPEVQALRQWMQADAENRLSASAWCCAEWIAESPSASGNASGNAVEVVDVAEAVFEIAGRLQLLERAALVARAAAGLHACGLSGKVVASSDEWLAAAQTCPAERFELLAHGANVLAAVGESERANAVFTLACERARRGQTGETKAPFTVLARARFRGGWSGLAERSWWLEGVRQAASRPGYQKRVAAALACGEMAASDGGFTEMEIGQACQAALRAAALAR